MINPNARRCAAIVFVFVSCFISCEKGGGGVLIPPVSTAQISSTTPGDGEGDVQAVSPVSALFSEEMDASSISPATFTIVRLPGNFQLAGSVSYSDGVATFTPASPLDSNASYRATLKSAVRDKKGRQRQGDFAWAFTTKDTRSPFIYRQLPLNAVDNSSLFAPITAEFSEPINPASISTSNFTLKKGSTPILGAVFAQDNQATFVPVASLDSASNYTATIGSGVQDLAGNLLDCNGELNCVWSWTTQDLEPPIVITNKPTGTGVDLVPSIYVDFSEKLAPNSVNSSTVILHDETLGQDIPMTVQYSDGPPTRITLSFNSATNDNPYSRLALLTNYKVTLSKSIRDAKGNALGSDFSWNFTTRNLATPPEVLESGKDAADKPTLVFSPSRKGFLAGWQQGQNNGGGSGYVSVLSNSITSYAPSVPSLQSSETFNTDLQIEPDNLGQNSDVAMAADPFGNVYAVFTSNNSGTGGKTRIFANKLNETASSWSAVAAEKISVVPTDESSSLVAPSVTVTPNGTAFAVWIQNTANDVYASRRKRTSNWSAAPIVIDLASQVATFTQVLASSDESCWVIWVQNGNTIYANRLYLDSGSGDVKASLTIPANLGSITVTQGAPRMAVASDNSAYVVWVASNRLKANRIYWESGTIKQGTVLAADDSSTGNAQDPQIAIATMDNDDAFIAWKGGPSAYAARLRKSGDSLIKQEGAALIEGAPNAQVATTPQVVIAPVPGLPGNDYRTFVAWLQQSASGPAELWLNWRSSSETTWNSGRAFTLDSNANTNNVGANFQVAADPLKGGVQAVWQQSDGFNSIFTAEYIP